MSVSEDRKASPSAAILDSQSVKTATFVAIEVGYDGAKKTKGRKRPLLVDPLGLVLMVVVSAASVPERTGAKQVFVRLQQLRHWVSRLVVQKGRWGLSRTGLRALGDGHPPLGYESGAASRNDQKLRSIASALEL